MLLHVVGEKFPLQRGINQAKLKARITPNPLLEAPSVIMSPKVGGITQPNLKVPIMVDTPIVRVTPPCFLCGKQGHVTNLCPTFLELRNFLNTLVSVMHATNTIVGGTPLTSSSLNKTNKSNFLHTNNAC